MSEADRSTDETNPDAVPSLVEGPLAHATGRFFYEPPENHGVLFKVSALNIAFALTSAVLFAVTVWAIWQDHNREWKAYAREWRSIQEEGYRKKIGEEDVRLAKENLRGEEARLASLTRELERQKDYQEAADAARKAKTKYDLAEMERKFFKSQLDAERFRFEEHRAHILDELKDTDEGKTRLAAVEKEFDEKWIRQYEHRDKRVEELKAEWDRVQKDADEKANARSELEKKIAASTRTKDQLRKNLRQVTQSFANFIRNAPLIPPYSPTDQIQKVVLNDLTEPLNFLDVPRVDRCKTCHVNIDEPDPSLASFSDPRSVHKGKLFRSHPRLDLFLSAASPHPYEQFGCTICHYGDGRATSFVFAAHTPQNEEQKADWETRFGWEKLHHQDYPMLPLTQISSTCAKCHPHESRIDGADAYNEGRSLVEDYGCFGCHRIQGFEKMRKVGPNLRHIGQKAELSFIYRWVKDPPSFRPTTRMPKFFDLANTTGKHLGLNAEGDLEQQDFGLRNEVEALAIASYVHGRTQPRPPEDFYRLPAGGPGIAQGDPARGKALIQKVGCLGCHSIVREGFVQNDHGPDLGAIGSKLKPEWLVDWIQDPHRHDPKTRMPRLRIEEDEGGPQKLADLVAYLMSLRDPDFEARPVPEVDAAREKVLREIAIDYARRGDTRAVAQAKVKEMGVPQLLQYAGERLVGRYGCFGCHEGISDEFDKMQPIGTELSAHGSKEIDKLDFARWGHQPSGDYAVPHDRASWFTTKLTDTRLFDTIPKEVRRSDGARGYEMTDEVVQKTPEELLKMPLFSFRRPADPPGTSPEDQARRRELRSKRIQSAVVFLLSRLDDRIPLEKTKRLSSDEETVEDGRVLIRFLNCQGCHRIGAEPHSIPVEELPFSSAEPTNEQRAREETEKETWLADSLKAGKMTIPAQSFISSDLKDENDPKGDEIGAPPLIASRQWEAARTPTRERRLKVLGYGEGKVRHYFGDQPEARPMAPPLLRKEGERVNADWLYRFLLNVKPLRPWLDIRMPSFHLSPDEAALLVRWFKVTTGAPYPPLTLKTDQTAQVAKYYEMPPDVPFPPFELKSDKERALADWLKARGRPPYPHELFPEHVLTRESRALAEEGREMFQTTFPGDQKAQMRLQCNSCHPAGDKKPSVSDVTSWGPDLGMARERLRPSWIARWVLDPQSYMPGTKMPNNFLSYDSLQGLSVLRPAFPHEVEAIIQYLMHMRELEGRATAAR